MHYLAYDNIQQNITNFQYFFVYQVLLLAANNIIKTSKVFVSGEELKLSQIYHFSRLVLLFEYMMKHLYEPPKTLMEQVQTNIFKKHLKQSESGAASLVQSSGLAYHSFREIEDNMSRLCKTNAGHMPRYASVYFWQLALPIYHA